jgi:hypothetical protein
VLGVTASPALPRRRLSRTCRAYHIVPTTMARRCMSSSTHHNRPAPPSCTDSKYFLDMGSSSLILDWIQQRHAGHRASTPSPSPVVTGTSPQPKAVSDGRIIGRCCPIAGQPLQVAAIVGFLFFFSSFFFTFRFSSLSTNRSLASVFNFRETETEFPVWRHWLQPTWNSNQKDAFARVSGSCR